MFRSRVKGATRSGSSNTHLVNDDVDVRFAIKEQVHPFDAHPDQISHGNAYKVSLSVAWWTISIDFNESNTVRT